MRRPPRIVILGAALAALGLWVVFDEPGRETAAPVAATAPALRAEPVARAPELPARVALKEITADPFSGGQEQQAAQEAAPADPAPEEQAQAGVPPLPYRFAGRIHKDGHVEILLARGDEIIPVKRGENLDGGYRVQKLGRSEMVLVHTATGTPETIEYGPPIKEEENRALAQAPLQTPDRSKHAAAQGRSQTQPEEPAGG
jgi:hypothetical protein